MQWWFKKFCKGDESLEDEECSGRPSKVDNNQIEPLSKITGLQLYKKFCKRHESLEDEECSGWLLEVDNDQLRAIIEVDHLTATKEVVQELIINSSIHHMKQIGKVEKLSKCVPHELTAKQKIIILRCCLSY